MAEPLPLRARRAHRDRARAITTERDIDKLLGLILEKSRFITGADAGSIYVVEGDDPAPRRMLRFKLSQNDSVELRLARVHDAGQRALDGRRRRASQRSRINIVDVYDLPPGSPFGFDRSFDDKIGYRTKSDARACRWSRARTRSSASSS